MAIVMVATCIPALLIRPADAALTSVTMTAMRAQAGTTGDRFDWSFTVGSTSTGVSSVSFGVPTLSAPYQYLHTPVSQAHAEAYTGDSVANSITGDMDIRAAIAPTSWASGSAQAIAGKWITATNNMAYSFQLSATGALTLVRSNTGAAQLAGSTDSTATVPHPTAAPVAVRVTVTTNNGAGGTDIKFYYKTTTNKTAPVDTADNTGWTQLGTTLTNAGTSSTFDSNGNLEIGEFNNAAATGTFVGRIYYADVRSGTNSTAVVNDFNPNESAPSSAASWTASSSAGETWTVDRSGAAPGPDLAADLSVANLMGLPSGGFAQLRRNEALVYYYLPSSQTVTAATAVKFGVMGLNDPVSSTSVTSVATLRDSSFASLQTGSASSLSFNALNIAAVGGSTAGYSGDGGVVSAAKFSSPTQMAGDSSGNTYVADTANNVVRVIDQFGYVSTLNIGATMSAPNAVYWDDPNNYVWILDSGNNSARRWNVTNSTLLTNVTTLPSGSQGLVWNNTSSFGYVSTADCRIVRFAYSGAVSNWAGSSGTCTSTGDGGLATAATFNNPKALATDAAGNIYVAEAGSSTTDGRVRRIDITTGIVTTVAGGGSSTSDQVLATKAQLNAPSALAIDPMGRIYVSFTGDRNVKMFTVGQTIKTLVGATTASSSGSTGDGAAATSATLTTPTGLAFNNGALWIGDNGVSKIRKVADQVPIAPRVNTDEFDVSVNVPTTRPLVSNDFKADGEMDISSAAITSPPSHAASYSLDNSNGMLTYVPATNYSGTDSLTYQACDSTGVMCGTATVNINVNGSTTSQSVLGNVAEDTSSSTGFQPVALARYRNYIYMVDATLGVVRRWDTYSNQVVVVAGSGNYATAGSTGHPATWARFISPNGIAVDPNGQLYLSDGKFNAILAIAPNGVLSRVAGTYASGSDPDGTAATSANIGVPGGVALAPDGTVAFTTNSMVRSFRVGGVVTTIAGSSTGAVNGTTGPAGTAQFSTPGGLSYASNGDLYVADTGNHAIRKISGGNVSTFAGTLGTSGNDATHLLSPASVAVDGSNNLLVPDTGNGVIKYVNSGTMSTIAGSGTLAFLDGTGLAARFKAPVAALPAASGTGYYVADQSNFRLRYSTANTTSGVVSTVVGSGKQAVEAAGGYGAATQVGVISASSSNPIALAADSSGNLFHMAYDKTMFKLDGSTQLTSSALMTLASGTSFANMSLDGSGNLTAPSASESKIYTINSSTLAQTTLISAGISGPRGVAWDPSRTNLYVANTGTNQILKWNGASLSVVAGISSGSGSDAGDGGPATSANLNVPYSVAVDAAGNVYINEYNGHRVRMVDTNGNITTLVNRYGTATWTGDGDSSYAATMGSAYQMQLDGAGNIFIVDASTRTLRKIDGSNNTSTVAGNGTVGSAIGTTAAATTFTQPKGMAIAGSNIYVAEDFNGQTYKFTGLASNPASNALKKATWTIAPGASGHSTTLSQMVVQTNADTTTSKMTFSVPPGTTGSSLTVPEAYGVPVTVTAANPINNIVTLSFASPFTMKAGINYEFGVSGLNLTGANGTYSSGVVLYDTSGSPAQVGWTRSTIVNLNSGTGTPAVGVAGYNSMWNQSTSIKVNSGASTNITVAPNGTTSGTTSIVVQSGNAGSDNLNNNALTVAATSATSSSPASTISPISVGVGTGVALTSTPNRWGARVASLTGTGTAAAAFSGAKYVGNTTTPQSFASGADGNNTYTLTNGAFVDWLQPAGVYTSTYTFRLSGGS